MPINARHRRGPSQDVIEDHSLCSSVEVFPDGGGFAASGIPKMVFADLFAKKEKEKQEEDEAKKAV